MTAAVLILAAVGVALLLAVGIASAVVVSSAAARIEAAPVCTLTDLAGPEHAAAYGEIARKLNGKLK